MTATGESAPSALIRNRYAILFATLSLLFVVTPQLSGVTGARVLTLASLLVLLGVVVAVSPRPRQTRWLAFLALLILPMLVWRVIDPSPGDVELGARLALAVFFALSVAMILRDVLRSSEVGAETIYGALSVYLLVAVLFSLVYWAVHSLDASAFRFPDSSDSSSDSDPWLYYSLVTLTTLGYGDIAPITPPARMLSAFEAVVGQVYLAVLIARLVGQSIMGARAER